VKTIPVLTKSLQPGDTVLTYRFPGASSPRSRSRAVTDRAGAYDPYGGTELVEVAYTEPVVNRTKWDKAGRDVHFKDGTWAKSLTNATWLVLDDSDPDGPTPADEEGWDAREEYQR
jgi:hypothetical protein